MVNLFEHSESMNTMKRKASLLKNGKWMRTTSKNQKCKNVFIISIIFFVKFRKDQNFLLL